MEEITLKNGTRVPDVLCNATMHALRTLFSEKPLVLYDFVMMCRNRGYKPFGDALAVLEEIGLIQNDMIHSYIRGIVLSAVVGDWPDMELVSPILEKPHG